VWADGRKQVAGGRHLRWDAIVADYRAAIRRISRAVAG
jgi:hypothetical protein